MKATPVKAPKVKAKTPTYWRSKGKAWRNDPATDKQLDLLMLFRCKTVPTTKGEASDILDKLIGRKRKRMSSKAREIARVDVAHARAIADLQSADRHQSYSTLPERRTKCLFAAWAARRHVERQQPKRVPLAENRNCCAASFVARSHVGALCRLGCFSQPDRQVG
jgi:hypothetical protein